MGQKSENVLLELKNELGDLQKLEQGFNNDFLSRLNIVISNLQKYC